MKPSSSYINVYKGLFERIAQAVDGTHDEVGGKLVGRVNSDDSDVRFEVVSYLDSGPISSSSSSHLIPDGEYQESLYRVLERFDPNLEHIGSWHSHHCNGLDNLSAGDIAGYIDSVNDPRYGCDHFLAILVVGVRKQGPVCRYYMFSKGSRDFSELPRGSIHEISKSFHLEKALKAFERASRKHLRGKPDSTNDSDVRVKTRSAGEGSRMRKRFLAEDNAWISEHFPGSISTRDKKTGTISWKWQRKYGGRAFTFLYSLPPDENAKNSYFEFKYGDKVLVAREVQLDSSRFIMIRDSYNVAVQQVFSVLEKEELKRTGRGRKNGYRNWWEDFYRWP